jgi:hypothetical protein
MAKYKSRYPELGFYCCGELHKFYNGDFSTEKDCEIATLEKLADAVRVDEPVVEAPKPKAPVKKK